MPARKRPPKLIPTAHWATGQTHFTTADLAAIAGCEVKSILLWKRRGLLSKRASARGRVDYGVEDARRARAIALLGVQAAKHPRFEELMAIALDEVPRPGKAPPPPAPSAEPDAPLPGPGWKHVPLMEGVEMQVAESVPPIVRAMVREVAKRFGKMV